MAEVIAFDFDGTLANFPSRILPNYASPRHSFLYANASLPIINLARAFRRDGYQIHVVTGRSTSHAHYLSCWMNSFGVPARIWCRPHGVSIHFVQLGEWKSQILSGLQPILFIGNNPQIDGFAAEQSNTPFLDANEYVLRLLGGESLESALINCVSR